MTDNPSIVLAAAGIIKTFGNHTALDKVDIAFHRGEVHALLGENGAGKSTLIKILTGAYIPDGGTITVDGEVVNFTHAPAAQTAGIGTVYQEVNLLPNMTVIDNLFIGRQPTNRFGLVDKRRMERESREILATYGLDIDVKASFPPFLSPCSRSLRSRGRLNCRARFSFSMSRPPASTVPKSKSCSGSSDSCAIVVSPSSSSPTSSIRSSNCRIG